MVDWHDSVDLPAVRLLTSATSADPSDSQQLVGLARKHQLGSETTI